MSQDSRQINLNQLMTLGILFLIGGSALTSTARYAGQNVWIVILIGALIGMLLFAMHFRMSKLHDYQGLPQICTNCLGKPIGKILLFIYGCFFFFRTLNTGNFMTQMVQQTLMSGVHTRLIVFLMLSTVLIAVIHGLNAFSRSSEILIVLVLISLLPFLLSIFSSGVFKTENLIPILSDGLPGIGKDSVRVAMLPFGELFVFLMLMPYIKTKEKAQSSIFKRMMVAIVIATVIMIAIDLTTIALIGSQLTGNFEYSFFNAMQLAGIKGFLERLDPLAIVIMVFSEYFKLAIYFIASLLAFEALHEKINIKWVIAILGVLVFMIAPIIDIENLHFTLETMPFIILPIFHVAIPFLLYVISEIKYRKKHQSASPPIATHSPSASSLSST